MRTPGMDLGPGGALPLVLQLVIHDIRSMLTGADRGQPI